MFGAYFYRTDYQYCANIVLLAPWSGFINTGTPVHFPSRSVLTLHNKSSLLPRSRVRPSTQTVSIAVTMGDFAPLKSNEMKLASDFTRS